MNIQERIEALETEFNEKIKALKAEAQREEEFPQVGDYYWRIGDDLEVKTCVWADSVYGKKYSSIGNVFKTEEQAQFAVEKLKVEAELRKYSRPFKRGRFNHYIFIDTDGNHLEVNSLIYGQPQGTIYFESKEKVQQAIQSVGEDRIKKYIFGVED